MTEADWEQGMAAVRERGDMSPSDLQQIWWLYPLYQDYPRELEELLESAQQNRAETRPDTSGSSRSGSDQGFEESSPDDSLLRTNGGDGSGARSQSVGDSNGPSEQPSTGDDTPDYSLDT